MGARNAGFPTYALGTYQLLEVNKVRYGNKVRFPSSKDVTTNTVSQQFVALMWRWLPFARHPDLPAHSPKTTIKIKLVVAS